MNLNDREAYENWFRAEYGQEPMPRTSPAHDFCYAGWKARGTMFEAENKRLRGHIEQLREAVEEGLSTYKVPMTARICEALALGEPCGYAIFKESRNGRPGVSDEEVLRRIADSQTVVAGLEARIEAMGEVGLNREAKIRQLEEMATARNNAEDEYFKARPKIDCNDMRDVFDAGFERAWAVRQAEIDLLRSQSAGHAPLCEALNSGDGTYRP